MKSKNKLFLGIVVALFAAGCGSGEQDYVDRMEEEHAGDEPVENAASAFPQEQPVDTMSVSYATVNGNEISGYVARPQDAGDELPGIIVIHEWWGLNDNIRMMTRRLAGQGYTALAVDLYNGKVAASSDSAGAYARQVGNSPGDAEENLRQAYDYLTGELGATQVGTIGWCFGGGWSLQTALAMPQQIDATVIYYGRLVTDPGQLETLDMPILGFFGAEDDGIPPSSAREFESVLDSLGKQASIHIYEGADHAFANPSGNSYNEQAATDAWQKTVDFFEAHLKNQ